MATDSRQSFRNKKGMARVGSDNASKLLQINKRIGVALTGLAFLQDKAFVKSTSKFIDEWRSKSAPDDLDVKEVAEKLRFLFDRKYNWKEQIEKLPEQIRRDLRQKGCEVEEVNTEGHILKFKFRDPQGKMQRGMGGVDQIVLLVAGYNQDGSHQVYTVEIPGEIKKKRDSNEKTKEYGASWIGQKDVVTRIVKGFDGRIGGLKFMNQISGELGEEEVRKQLNRLEYVIQWGTMTLQDAIDFCVLMIETTSAIQRFSDGVLADPGDIPGVGGPIDVAVITPEKGFVWIQKKKLQVGDTQVDLDKEPSV